jgi:hypothetical protein
VGTHRYPCRSNPRSTCRRNARDEVMSRRGEVVASSRSCRVHGDKIKERTPEVEDKHDEIPRGSVRQEGARGQGGHRHPPSHHGCRRRIPWRAGEAHRPRRWKRRRRPPWRRPARCPSSSYSGWPLIFEQRNSSLSLLYVNSLQMEMQTLVVVSLINVAMTFME